MFSYYRLIKSYSATLKENGKYIDGTTFENIVELYKFDIEIRHILFLLIEHIEVYLRAVITNYFSLNYDFGEILLYAAIEVSSFGTLSKMYKNMKNYDKKEISKIFNVDYTYLESWIENIAYVRNICAHYGRLYGAKFIKMPKLYSEYLNRGISNNYIFASILNLKLLAKQENYNKFYRDLLEIIEKYPFVDLKYLGFIQNWKELL